jgi:hypothetical protein
MHKDFVYFPSYATDISKYTLKHKLEAFKNVKVELNDLIYVANTTKNGEITVTADFLENIEELLEKVLRREV